MLLRIYQSSVQEYKLYKEVVRPDFAIVVDEDDRFIAKDMYLIKMEKI